MSVTNFTVKHLFLSSWLWIESHQTTVSPKQESWDLLKPLRNWLDEIEISDRLVAHRICKLIPSQCPFARQIKLFGKTLLTIPPLCKLNPLYNELMMLRFRAISYLADQCGEDVSPYC
jgi:hypothetical protein